MAQSINTRVDVVVEATSYQGLTNYGKIMVGDKGFEFFNTRNVNDYIQIPWEEVDYVIASVMFKGKKIPRYAIQTKKNGTFSFSSKVSVLIPITSPPIDLIASFNSLILDNSATQGLQPVNQKFMTVTAFPENKF